MANIELKGVELKGMDMVNRISMGDWFEMNLTDEKKVIDRVTEELAQAAEEYARWLRDPEEYGDGDEDRRLRAAQEKYDAITVVYYCIWGAFDDDPLRDESYAIAEAVKYAEQTSDAEVVAAINRIVEVYNAMIKYYKEWRHIK